MRNTATCDLDCRWFLRTVKARAGFLGPIPLDTSLSGFESDGTVAGDRLALWVASEPEQAQCTFHGKGPGIEPVACDS